MTDEQYDAYHLLGWQRFEQAYEKARAELIAEFLDKEILETVLDGFNDARFDL